LQVRRSKSAPLLRGSVKYKAIARGGLAVNVIECLKVVLIVEFANPAHLRPAACASLRGRIVVRLDEGRVNSSVYAFELVAEAAEACGRRRGG